MNKTTKAILLSITIFLSSNLWAAGWEDFQVFFNMGMVNGTYSNPLVDGGEEDANNSTNVSNAESGFSVVPSFNFGLEYFSDLKTSYFTRAIISMDTATGKMRYSYLGLGGNKYFSSVGLMRSYVNKDAIVKSFPKWRHYYGWDLGLSRVIVVSFGNTLNAVSTGLDFGGHLGTNYHMGKTWALNMQLGMSYAFGFSTVAVTGTNMKFFFGTSFFF